MMRACAFWGESASPASATARSSLTTAQRALGAAPVARDAFGEVVERGAESERGVDAAGLLTRVDRQAGRQRGRVAAQDGGRLREAELEGREAAAALLLAGRVGSRAFVALDGDRQVNLLAAQHAGEVDVERPRALVAGDLRGG